MPFILKNNVEISPLLKTYCDFRDREKYDYKNPKDKLLKFFEMIFDDSSNFEWYDEHPGEDINNLNFTDSFDTCFAKDTTQKPTTNYFCDKELMGLLFFDAKLTHEEFLKNTSEDERRFMEVHKIQVKFVSTQSGLTRWKYFFEDDVTIKEFGEVNNKALDEVWYKSAVLLHQLKSQNFVFSVPKTYGNSSEKYVTASHAIFYNDSENEAPGVVVGFQIAYQTIKELIENNSKCGKSHNDCYMIDANGYVVYAQEEKHLGQFFGEVEGAVMEQMIALNIFRKLSMYDYQAFDNEPKATIMLTSPFNSPASSSIKLLNGLSWFIEWIVSKLLWKLVELNFWFHVDASSSCSNSEPMNPKDISNENGSSCRKAQKSYSDVCKTREVSPHIERNHEDENKLKKTPVDKRFFLYLYTNLSAYGYKTDKNKPKENCSRPFFANRISNTNLILVSVDTSFQTCYKNLNVSQNVIEYKSDYPRIPACNKKVINSYPRKKLRGCSDKMLENRTTPETCGSKRTYNLTSIFSPIFCLMCLLLHSNFYV